MTTIVVGEMNYKASLVDRSTGGSKFSLPNSLNLTSYIFTYIYIEFSIFFWYSAFY